MRDDSDMWAGVRDDSGMPKYPQQAAPHWVLHRAQESAMSTLSHRADATGGGLRCCRPQPRHLNNSRSSAKTVSMAPNARKVQCRHLLIELFRQEVGTEEHFMDTKVHCS